MRFTFLVLLIALCSFTSINERESILTKKYFVQFIVSDVNNKSEAVEIDMKMRELPGVQSSRMDYVSKKYYAIIDGEHKYNEEFFNDKFKKLGFQITCFRRGIHGKDKVINQSFDCE